MSIDKPQPARIGPAHLASLHLTLTRAEMQSGMQLALRELTAAMQSQANPPVGPWFTHHHRRPAETFDFDVCFPVGKPIAATGRVKPSSLPTTEVMRTVHHGGYHQLPQAWQEFTRAVAQAKVATRDDLFEVYRVGPQDDEDPDGWRTELNLPLAGTDSDTKPQEAAR